MKIFLSALVLVAAIPGTESVQAMPLASPSPASNVVAVKDGCGIGFHRLSSGVCRPQPEGPRLMRLFARKCPLGYRRNLMGKCRKE
jgi:hypothetical protein